MISAIRRRIAVLGLFVIGSSLTAADVLSNLEPGAEPPVVEEGEPFTLELPFRNPYDHAVKVAKLDSTCICNRLEVADTFLLPHQETVLHFEVANDDRSGAQMQRVWIEFGDPLLPILEARLRWEIEPYIAVDTLSGATELDQRPGSKGKRDVYGYPTSVRPDELHRLRHVIRLWSPPDQRPAGGLLIERIDYDGDLWEFELRERDDGGIILIATAAETAATLAVGKYEEPVILHTNHPLKSEIELVFYTAIDPEAGRPGSLDPWNNLR